MGGTRRRLDAELVRRHMTPTREGAQRLIADGLVQVNGIGARKPASQVDDTDSIVLTRTEVDDFVSRGGLKLAGAIAEFRARGLRAISGRLCLDAGASTGGFTDALLREGAAKVEAVDVGYGQLAWKLRTDPAVTVRERINVRHLKPDDLAYRPDLTVADLSFISLRLVLPALIGVTAAEGDIIVLVKPQFEVGRGKVGRGGVVRDPVPRAEAVETVSRRAADLGWGTVGLTPSQLPGPAGNVEYFLWFRRGGSPLSPDAALAAVEAGPP